MSQPPDSPLRSEQTSRYSVPQLRHRGWSPAMIRDLLGVPDDTSPNPRFRSAAPMGLYAAQRVEDVENTPDFATRARQAARRGAAARAVAERKRAATLEQMRRRPIELPLLGREQLSRRAIAHYNELLARSGDPVSQCPSPNHPNDIAPDTLLRWEVNYLRHVLTPYDTLLAELSGRIGRVEAEMLVRRRVYTAIAVRYPHLACECDRQLAERVRFEG